jgi:hypothetical protein
MLKLFVENAEIKTSTHSNLLKFMFMLLESLNAISFLLTAGLHFIFKFPTSVRSDTYSCGVTLVNSWL